MFRVTQYLRQLVQAQATGQWPQARRGAHLPGAAPAAARPSAARPAATPGCPQVVIWNLTRRCNLTCTHCYALSADHAYPGELSTDDVNTVMDDLHAYGVPVLILSGGEPLLRADLFDIARRACRLGFYTGLSTNGTLIDAACADRIAATGFDYVGISLDGLKDTHDRFRRLPGAFDASLAAVQRLRRRGVKVGLRFTLTQPNAHDLPALLQLMRDEGAGKFYLSHLNYAGRGNLHRGKDAHFEATRAALDLLFDHAWAAACEGRDEEYVTGNNDADGAWLLHWLARREPALHAAHGAALRRRLVAWGGNASGVAVANIDNLGHVHPDTMWWHHDLGQVRQRPFSQIWPDTRDPLMAGLKAHPRPVQGRCAACSHFGICGGNTRVRAQQLTGDAWAEDPGCYLTDDEIGLAGRTEERVALTPFRSSKTGHMPVRVPVVAG